MKCCVSTDVGTWTNWLTFYPDPDYSPDAPTYVRIGGPPLQRSVVLKWFYSPSRRNTFVGGTCALPSALQVINAVVRPEAAQLKLPRHGPSLSSPLHRKGTFPVKSS